MKFRLLLLLLLCAAVCEAAPITVKEIQFLVRQRTPEGEIVQEVTRRRLLAPLDAAGEEALREAGATEPLIAALGKPELALSAADAQAEIVRQRMNQTRVAQSAAEDAAALQQQLQRQQKTTATLQGASTTRRMLDGRLVKLQGDEVRAYDARNLEGVRVFAFYFSAGYGKPSRKFTEQLVSTYGRLKTQYPGAFEVIFVSLDGDEFNMAEYMRTERMPWPAVRYGAATAEIKQFKGENTPWLVAISDAGQPLTQNGVDKKYIPPTAVLEGIEHLLTRTKP